MYFKGWKINRNTCLSVEKEEVVGGLQQHLIITSRESSAHRLDSLRTCAADKIHMGVHTQTHTSQNRSNEGFICNFLYAKFCSEWNRNKQTKTQGHSVSSSTGILLPHVQLKLSTLSVQRGIQNSQTFGHSRLHGEYISGKWWRA